MEQSECFIWQQRYKTDMPEPEIAQKELVKEDIKDLDASQEFAFNLRYSNSAGGKNDIGDMDKQIDKDDFEPDKD